MKYIAIILVGILVVVAFVYVLLIERVTRPNVTIRAVGPTGNVIRLSRAPTWRFAITNKGPNAAHWNAYVEVKRPNGNVGPFLGMPSVPGEYLRALHGEDVELAVPTESNLMWRAVLSYKWQRRPAWLAGLLFAEKDYFDSWHPATNVGPDAPVSPTAQ